MDRNTLQERRKHFLAFVTALVMVFTMLPMWTDAYGDDGSGSGSDEPACEHKNKVLKPYDGQEATCVEGGMGYWYCNDCGLAIEEKVEIQPLGHIYNNPPIGWTWTGYTKAEATFTCSRCNEAPMTQNATISDDKAVASCTEEVKKTYTATVEYNGKKYNDTQIETLNPTGHAWSGPVWNWSTDFSSATATFTCSNCQTNETPVVEVASTGAPTCTEGAEIVYTATTTFENKTYTDTKKETVSAKGHAWSEPAWNWAEDFSSATVTFTCTSCKTKETPDVKVTSTGAPTCTEGAEIVYTACSR